MNPDNPLSIFGTTFPCECGRTHTVEPRTVIHKPRALDDLPEVCARVAAGRDVSVCMDVRTRRAAGAAVCEKLADAGWNVHELVVPDRAEGQSPVCDQATKDSLYAPMSASDLIIAVGGGTLNDLGKWIAFETAKPFVTCPTAASMNGYASSNVAASIAGVKSLLESRPPGAIVADADVIRHAPLELTSAGLGDVLAKSVSSTDWLLNHLLFGDYYCPRAVRLVADVEPLYMNHPERLTTAHPDAVDALFQGLLLTGAAMTMAGTSAPASGGEHLISHSLDMMSTLDGVEHDLHGRQVGLGAVLASDLYRRALALESPDFLPPTPRIDTSFWGPLAAAVDKEHSAKTDRLRRASKHLARADAWDNLRARLAPLTRSPETIRDCLARAGAACRAEHIALDKPRLVAAFLHAHEIRSRVTVLDLARLVGILPHAAADIIDAWT